MKKVIYLSHSAIYNSILFCSISKYTASINPNLYSTVYSDLIFTALLILGSGYKNIPVIYLIDYPGIN